MTVGKVKIRAGFVLLVSALVYLDQGFLLPVVFAAALLHELGHYIPLRLLGGRVARLELTGGGIDMESVQPMGYGRELVTVLSGPAVSLVFALLLTLFDGMIEWRAPLAGMCLSHGVFNLLPMRGLDGGRALELTLGAFGARRGWKVLDITTAVTALGLALLCGVLAWRYRNMSMLLAMIYVLSSAIRRKQRQW